MKHSVIVFLLFSLLNSVAHAQQMLELTENKASELNGLEYGFFVTNESNKEIKGEEFDRYEVEVYVTNKSGCVKLIPTRTVTSGNSENELRIAEFNCINATGKRLTAKKATVNARPWYTNVRIPDETVKEKFRMVNALVGYAIRNGQTVSARIIVIVPKGERPKFNCRAAFFPELN